MSMPIYQALKKYAEKNSIRFHTPGNKGHLDGIDDVFAAFSQYDVTELTDSDDLYNPKSAILEAEQAAQKFYNTNLTIFSAGGATLCIQTALSLFRGKKVLFERNTHSSIHTSSAFLDIDSVYIHNQINDFGIPEAINFNELEKFLEKDPEIEAFFITSPNYYGVCADIKNIKKVCEKFNVTLIVDQAHGSHLFLSDKSLSATDKADIIIDSAHKTLPVLTGGAFLHFNIDISREKAKNLMRNFGSTSPFFPILASLDYARNWCETIGQEITLNINKNIKKLQKIIINNGYFIKNNNFQDIYHLTIITENDGEVLNNQLYENNIIAEMHDKNTVLLLFSPTNIQNDFDIITDFFESHPYNKKIIPKKYIIPKLETVIKTKTAMFANNKALKLKNSVNKICHKAVFAYPPGTPIILPGEKISAEMIDFIKNNYEIDTVHVLI